MFCTLIVLQCLNFVIIVIHFHIAFAYFLQPRSIEDHQKTTLLKPYSKLHFINEASVEY